MHSHWNSSQQQHYSTITRYDPSGSEKISFVCSELYVAQLASLRAITDIKQLKDLSFYHPVTASQEKPPIQEQGKTKKDKRSWQWKIPRIIITGLLVVAGCLTHFPKYSYFTEKVTANVITASPEYIETSVLELAAARGNVPITPDITDVSQSPAAAKLASQVLPAIDQQIPHVELEDVINFTVPKGHVALTFDDGPSPYTKGIADVLKEYGVGGTFFFVGDQVKKHPEAVKYVSDEGFAIGNHSMTHSSFPQMPQVKQKQEITHTNELIEEITSSPVYLFRPPYGATHPEMQDILDKYNMKIVLWNRDPEDWNTNDPKQILNYITNSNASGSIILLHETQTTLDVLPAIIEYLQKQQLQISNLN